MVQYNQKNTTLPASEKKTGGERAYDERSRSQNTEGLQRADRDFEEGGLG